MASIFIGCAGWSIPRPERTHFPASGTHLERYASRLPAVEINSSFYRPHRLATCLEPLAVELADMAKAGADVWR